MCTAIIKTSSYISKYYAILVPPPPPKQIKKQTNKQTNKQTKINNHFETQHRSSGQFHAKKWPTGYLYSTSIWGLSQPYLCTTDMYFIGTLYWCSVIRNYNAVVRVGSTHTYFQISAEMKFGQMRDRNLKFLMKLLRRRKREEIKNFIIPIPMDRNGCLHSYNVVTTLLP